MGVRPVIGVVALLLLLAPVLRAAPQMDSALWSPLVPRVAEGQEYFVATTGTPAGQGTQADPWDLASTLKGEHGVEPGSVVWLRAGRYVYPLRQGGLNGFAVSLSGAPGKPVHIRAWPGERVTIDGGFEVNADHLWIWDLEFEVGDDWRPRSPSSEGQNTVFPVPTGVVNVVGRSGIRVIHCVSHHNWMGLGFWKSASDGEVYGCIIYDNGFLGTDRPHGPALYSQNESGTPRLVADNIIAGNFSLPLQLYGSRMDQMVNDFAIEGNIIYAPREEARGRNYLLLGGDSSHNMVFRDNFVYGHDVRLGRSGGQVAEGNVVVRGAYDGPSPETNELLADPGPKLRPLTILRPSRYDPRRAHLVVTNWGCADVVTVDLGVFLKRGDDYQVLSPLDFHGVPLAEGTYDGTAVSIRLPAMPWTPMLGDPREVGVFIVCRGSLPTGG